MADKLYYALHTSDAAFGLPARHIIYGFATRKDRDDYIARVARERESFAKIKRERGYCDLAIATTWDHAETIPAALVNQMINAARAKYPKQARYIDLYETGIAPYSSDPHAAAFLY
ncbi:MAG: hypothetical protein IKF78_16275 [Atopobiaceae bacterium]|nr:hypothetical protein [Atopobiaceae bacterium]